jgi:hypothetical protein
LKLKISRNGEEVKLELEAEKSFFGKVSQILLLDNLLDNRFISIDPMGTVRFNRFQCI